MRSLFNSLAWVMIPAAVAGAIYATSDTPPETAPHGTRESRSGHGADRDRASREPALPDVIDESVRFTLPARTGSP